MTDASSRWTLQVEILLKRFIIQNVCVCARVKYAETQNEAILCRIEDFDATHIP